MPGDRAISGDAMRKIEVGVTQADPAWLQILGQERVNYQVWDKTFTEATPRVMIVNHALSAEEAVGVRSHIESGAGVLTDYVNLAKLVPDFKYAPLEAIAYIEPEAHPVFDSIGILDLGLPGFCSNQANIGRLDNQGAALFAQKLGKGFVIALPFDVAAALRDQRRGLKAFFFDCPELPYEEVATTTQSAVRRLVTNCLRELSRHAGVLYMHLWYYPRFKHTAFAFRVDGDFASKDQLEKTAKLAAKHNLKFSWYVNAKAHRSLTSMFSDLARQGHDIQLHCYEHKVFDDLEHNLTNLKAGLDVMHRAGFKPVAAVGPFGHWNESLNQAMEQCGIKYSSEFGLAYDDFPFLPLLSSGVSRVMQVPVHPMCFGRLLQAKMKADAIAHYFAGYFNVRYAGAETMFIYDHPHRIAENTAAFDAIFKLVSGAKDIWLTTLTEFHEWWQARSGVEFEASIEKDILAVEAGYDIDQALHIVDGDREALVPVMSREFELDEINWRPVRRKYPFKPEMLKTKKLGRHIWLREQVWKAGKLLHP
jgi:hypothetical protein